MMEGGEGLGISMADGLWMLVILICGIIVGVGLTRLHDRIFGNSVHQAQAREIRHLKERLRKKDRLIAGAIKAARREE